MSFLVLKVSEIMNHQNITVTNKACFKQAFFIKIKKTLLLAGLIIGTYLILDVFNNYLLPE